MKNITLISENALDTENLAKKITTCLKPGNVVLLSGDLGAGKTTFVGGVLKSLGYNDHVISPTFNILKCYFEVTPHVYHIDAYRLEDADHDLGLEEFIEGDGLTFVEWPQFIEELIPSDHISIKISRINDSKRSICIEADENKYVDMFKVLEK